MKMIRVVFLALSLIGILTVGGLTRRVNAGSFSCGTCQCYMPNIDDYGYIDNTLNACVSCPYCSIQ